MNKLFTYEEYKKHINEIAVLFMKREDVTRFLGCVGVHRFENGHSMKDLINDIDFNNFKEMILLIIVDNKPSIILVSIGKYKKPYQILEDIEKLKKQSGVKTIISPQDIELPNDNFTGSVKCIDNRYGSGSRGFTISRFYNVLNGVMCLDNDKYPISSYEDFKSYDWVRFKEYKNLLGEYKL